MVWGYQILTLDPIHPFRLDDAPASVTNPKKGPNLRVQGLGVLHREPQKMQIKRDISPKA